MKLKLVAALALSLAVFTGCGSSEEATTAPETSTETSTEESTDGEVVKSEIAQDENTLVTEVTFDADGNPVSVNIDIIMEDGKSKYEEAKAGNYVMVEGSDNTWDKQIDAIEAFIVEKNFDLTAIEGEADAVTGVSIAVPGVLAGVQEILAQ